MNIRIGSRGSALALAQTNNIAQALSDLGHETKLIIVQTAGDLDQDRCFSEIGPAGVFVREIETAILDDEIDLAVHSYKDLPSQGPEELVVAAIPERLAPEDCLIMRDDGQPDQSPSGLKLEIDLRLKKNAVVGTSSERRRALLRSLRPDLQIVPIRGNVPTRLAKLHEGQYDAIVLAAAGLIRLGHQQKASALNLGRFVNLRLDPTIFVPAPAQGALALQCREGDRVIDAVAPLHDVSASGPVRAERELLRLVDGGCSLPFGAWCRRVDGGDLELISVLESDGVLVRKSGRAENPDELAAVLWAKLSHTLPETPTDGTSLEA